MKHLFWCDIYVTYCNKLIKYVKDVQIHSVIICMQSSYSHMWQ